MSGIIGMMGGLAGSSIQQGQTLGIMNQQVENQKELNEDGQRRAKENWDYTNYENQRKHMEKAGLNIGMMYGGSGAGGATMGGGSGGGAVGGSAPDSKITQGMGVGLQAEALKSQIELNRANANKANADAGLGKEKTVTELSSRDVMIENMKQSGIGQWFENIKTTMMREGADNMDEVTVFTNKVFGKDVRGYNGESPEVQKFNQELFKTVAEKNNLDASALLTNEKAKGYWQELLNATNNSDSVRIQAIAQKLSAEWNTGEFTNWKTWAELGLRAVQTAGNLVRGGTTINKTSTYNQHGDRINDVIAE